MPWPTARKAVPIAAVVFPLPGPVFTMMRPRRTSAMVGGLILLELLCQRRPKAGLPLQIDILALAFMVLLQKCLSFPRNWCIQPCVSGCKQISVPRQTAEGLVVFNNCLMLLFCVLAALPAFSAQRLTLHPRPSFDSPDQETIRQIVDMERQSKEASLRRDSDFSLRTLADDYVAITPLGQVTTKAE